MCPIILRVLSFSFILQTKLIIHLYAYKIHLHKHCLNQTVTLIKLNCQSTLLEFRHKILRDRKFTYSYIKLYFCT